MLVCNLDYKGLCNWIWLSSCRPWAEVDISNKIQQEKVLTPTSELCLDQVQNTELLAVNDNVEPCETTLTELSFESGSLASLWTREAEKNK